MFAHCYSFFLGGNDNNGCIIISTCTIRNYYNVVSVVLFSYFPASFCSCVRVNNENTSNLLVKFGTSSDGTGKNVANQREIISFFFYLPFELMRPNVLYLLETNNNSTPSNCIHCK